MEKATYTAAHFSPNDVEGITELSTTMQRDWRRRGFIETQNGHAKFDPFEVATIWIAKTLADRLNGWEKGNDLIYKLEADKLKSVTDDALKNETLVIKNNNSTTTIVIAYQNATATQQVNASNNTSQLPQKNLTVDVNQTSNSTANKTQNTS